MPTTVRGTPSISTVRPTSVRSPPNADCQSSYDSTVTWAPPGRVSATSKVRPTSGGTANARNRSVDTRATSIRRGRSGAVRFAWSSAIAPTTEKACVHSLNSKNSGGETQNWSNPIVGKRVEM